MRFSRKTVIMLIFLSILIFAGCGKQEETKMEEVKIPVKLSKAQMGEINHNISFTGTIRSDQSVEIYSKIAARIETVFRDEGDFVPRGTILAKLQDDDLRAQLKQAQAALEVASARLNQSNTSYDLTSTTTNIQVLVAETGVSQANESVIQANASFEHIKKDYERMQNLYEKGAIARQQLDQVSMQYQVAKSSLDAAKARLRQAGENLHLTKANTKQANLSAAEVNVAGANVMQAQANVEYLETILDYSVIRAPIDGYITYKNAEIGMLVAPGDKIPIFTITDNRIVYLEADIPESRIMGLSKGREVNVTVDALKGRTFKGHISTIIPTADPKSRTFRIKVAIKNTENLLADGMSAMVDTRFNTYKGVVIPRHWIKVIEGDFYVVVIDDNGEALHRKVTAGYYDEEEVLIVEGLEAGDELVSTGQSSLNDGDKVDIKE